MIVEIPCRCPGNHGQDTVTLREALTPHDAMAISKDIQILKADDPDSTAGDVLAVLSEGYILRGIESWTLVAEDGKALPVTKSAVRDRILADLEVASAVSEVADGLYAEAVMLPLLRMASSGSPSTPTDDSTSAPTDSGTALQKRPKRSSISTTPTDGTAETYSSGGGDSSFSPSSVSAA